MTTYDVFTEVKKDNGSVADIGCNPLIGGKGKDSDCGPAASAINRFPDDIGNDSNGGSLTGSWS